MLEIQRYDKVRWVVSNLDPLEDTLGFVQAMQAEDYTTEVLRSVHGLKARAAVTRARQITTHIRAVLSFVDQARGSDRAYAFLPAYYAILNMLKIGILAGPHGGELQRQRWHGATYALSLRDRKTPLHEKITVKKGGAIPLYYKTITGTAIQSDVSLSLADVYPYITGIEAEMALVSGLTSRIAEFGCYGQQVVLTPRYPGPVIKLQTTPVFKAGWTKKQGHPEFTAPACPPGVDGKIHVKQALRRYLLYHPIQNIVVTPLSARWLHFPEELPIALAFFHMSNVVRYNPEYLSRLQDTRFWAVLVTLQRHSLLTSLILLWSNFHKETLHLSHGGV